MTTRLPLEGIRIIDLTIVWAGPYASLLLGDMGAELIRVESLQHPDINTRGQVRVPPAALATAGSQFPDRTPGPRPFERTATFNYTGRHKLSVTMDITRPKGREMFLRLVRQSDALLENNAAGTLEKLGVTWEMMLEANPRFIIITMPGYGNSGPYTFYKGYGANVEAVVGHTWLRGYADMDPTTTTPVYHADAAAGATAAFALLAALNYRTRTGKGQVVDISQAENTINQLPQPWMDYAMNRRVQGTLGNRHPGRAPQGVYPCAGEDSWVAISVGSDAEWAALCGAMGRPDLAGEARFADVVGRIRHHDAIDPHIAAWTEEHTHYEVMHTLQAVGVPAGPVLQQPEVFQDPHLRARGFFETVSVPHLGTHDYPGPSFKLSKTAAHIRRPAPRLGEHNAYVYREILGVTEDEYAELVRERHIGDTYDVLLSPE
ncbi:MAG: CoA transferase [Chloroflexi bacterium]|nr:CoA transferase [Chloroflexota bacterium]